MENVVKEEDTSHAQENVRKGPQYTHLSSAKPYYEATDGVGALLYALLELEQVLNHPQGALAKPVLLVGKGDDKIPIGLDNW